MDKKIQDGLAKHEDEMILRMHFENKVNLLYGVNQKLESQNLQLSENNKSL